MPAQFCNLPYISIYIESYICLVWKFLPIFCSYCCVWCCTFIMPMIYPLFIAVVGFSYLCVYLSCWVATNVYSWINIYTGWTNNGNTRHYRNKTVCVGCTKRTLVVSFVCLCCVVPLSMHYRLCLVTVCVKILQNGTLLRFSKRTDSCAHLAVASVTKMATLLGVSIAAVSKVMTTYTNHGRTPSARRNSCQKPKLSERDHCTLKRIVSKNHRSTAAKVTAELNNHLEDRIHKNSLTRASQIQNPW